MNLTMNPNAKIDPANRGLCYSKQVWSKTVAHFFARVGAAEMSKKVHKGCRDCRDVLRMYCNQCLWQSTALGEQLGDLSGFDQRRSYSKARLKG